MGELKKVLYIERGLFVLPEDFEGDRTDALTELLKYHISEEAKKKRTDGTEKMETGTYDPGAFMKDNDQFRLTILAGVYMWDRDKNELLEIESKEVENNEANNK